MLHQKNKESLQDKQLKDKNRAVAKRENEREMLRKKQQNMQVNSYEPETEMVEGECWKTHKKVGMKMKGGKLVNDCRPKNESVSPADANKEKMLQKKQLMLNRQKLQLQTKAVNSGQKTDMSMRKESLTLSNFLEGKSKKKKNPDVEIMPEVDSEKGVKESADCPVCGCDPCQCLEGMIDERTRYAKETGKDPQTGKPSEKGGTIKPGSAMSKVRKSLAGQGLMSSRRKAIQPQGKKKEKGKKGYQGQTPVDRIKSNLARKRAPKPDIGSRFD
jgi:hypothetical protein